VNKLIRNLISKLVGANMSDWRSHFTVWTILHLKEVYWYMWIQRRILCVYSPHWLVC